MVNIDVSAGVGAPPLDTQLQVYTERVSKFIKTKMPHRISRVGSHWRAQVSFGQMSVHQSSDCKLPTHHIATFFKRSVLLLSTYAIRV